MFGFMKKLFSGTASADYKALVSEGALIVDVRTPSEYAGGHIQGSVNIPLQVLHEQLHRLPKDKAIITCCAGGMRSSSAESLLSGKGYRVYNGGGWAQLQRVLSAS